jgi:hypothetical protein
LIQLLERDESILPEDNRQPVRLGAVVSQGQRNRRRRDRQVFLEETNQSSLTCQFSSHFTTPVNKSNVIVKFYEKNSEFIESNYSEISEKRNKSQGRINRTHPLI